MSKIIGNSSKQQALNGRMAHTYVELDILQMKRQFVTSSMSFCHLHERMIIPLT